MTRGLDALLGLVEVRIGNFDARFLLDGGNRDVATTIAPPGATIGRAVDVDQRLVGPDTELVGRRHLLVGSTEHQWTLRDLQSRNGTWEMSEDGWRELPITHAIPIRPKMKLRLGPYLVLHLDLIVREPGGGTTPGGSVAVAHRLEPPELEAFAAALVAEHRADPLDRSDPLVNKLAHKCEKDRSTIYRWIDRLTKITEVKEVTHNESPHDVADAVAVVFPYLVDRA